VRLALAGTWLFWTNKAARTVSKINTITHLVMSLAENQDAPISIIANDGYYSSAFYVAGERHLRTTAAGSALGIPVTASSAIGGLALQPTQEPTIYFSAGLGLYRAGMVGAVELGAEETGVPMALALDAGRVAFVTKEGNVDVFVENSPDGQLPRCATNLASATNHACTRVAANQTRLLLDEVYFVGAQVYWASGASIYRALALPASGPLSPIATTAHGGDVTSFFLSGTTLYLAEDGYIERVEIGASVTATPIVSGQPHPTSVRADGNNVYWSRPDCAIVQVLHD
jgi:hypothetical protein